MGDDFAIAYLAAGVSSRFNYQPKFFVKIGSKTFIEHSLDQSLRAGFSRIFFVVNKTTEPLFIQKFGHSYKGIPIIYSRQDFDPEKRDKPWGNVDALCTLKGKIDTPFVFCNGDDLYGSESFRKLYGHLLNQSAQSQSRENASVWYRLGNVIPQTGGVNRAIFQEEGEYVAGIEERFSITRNNLGEKGLSLEDKCSMNIFALFPEMLDLINEQLLEFKEKNRSDRKKECLTGTKFSELVKKMSMIIRLYPSESEWAGLTSTEDISFVRDYLMRHKSKVY